MAYFDINYIISIASDYINPINAIIASGVALLTGVCIFAIRHKKSKDKAKLVA